MQPACPDTVHATEQTSLRVLASHLDMYTAVYIGIAFICTRPVLQTRTAAAVVQEL